LNPQNIELLLNLLALFFCSVAVYAWDEVYGITRKGKISGGWIYLMAATILSVIGLYPSVASFFYQSDPDFQKFWALSSKVLEGVFLMVAGIVFYNTIYRSLRTADVTSRPKARGVEAKEKATEEQPSKPSEDAGAKREQERRERPLGLPTEDLLRGVLGRLSLYWGPDVSRQLLIQTVQGRIPEREILRILSEYLPITDEEKWKQKWAV